MKARRVLFRGGPLDGKVREIDAEVARATVPVIGRGPGIGSVTYQPTGTFDGAGVEIWEVPTYGQH